MNTELLSIIFKFVIATLLGSLIGLERQFAVRRWGDKIDRGYIGIRTFSFYALLGAIAEYIGMKEGVWIIIVSFSGLFLLVTAYYYFTVTKVGDRGITTEVSSLITFWLGALVIRGDTVLAVTLAVVVTFLQSIKPRTDKLTKKVTEEELFAVLEFVLLSFVVLPILPNKGYGPYNFFNPYEIWLFVVLILGISFAGYLAIKFVGPGRGIGLTSLLGGLASSTAVTLSFSRRSVSNPELSGVLSMGIITASSIMYFRMIVIIWVINQTLGKLLLIPLGLSGIGGLVFAAYLYYIERKHVKRSEQITLSNPFRLSQGIYLGLLYTVIIYLVEYVKHVWGSKGVLWFSFISGLPDVDPILLSFSKLGGKEVSLLIAAKGVIIASIANSITKMVLTYILGRKKVKNVGVAGFLIMIFISLISMIFLLPV